MIIATLIGTLASEGGPAQTPSAFMPEAAEYIYGGLASTIVIGALIKFAGPVAKKGFVARTERIQAEIDSARDAKAQAANDAEQIRSALGDISSERARILADADQQAAALVTEGRARVAAEMADIESKALSDIATASGRAKDDLEAEIKRLARAAADRVIAQSMNDSTQQALVEGFINNVGAAR